MDGDEMLSILMVFSGKLRMPDCHRHLLIPSERRVGQ
jgi:hypothetical protein